MVRKPDGGTTLSEWTELNVMLFDHYFVMTKMKRIDDTNVRYHTWRTPIVLELIRVTGFNEPSERKSRGLRNITGTLGQNSGLERGNSDPYSHPQPSTVAGNAAPQDDRSLFPITIHSLGRYAYSVTLYVDSERSRQTWKTKFEEAIGMRMQILDTYKVFDLHPMTDQTFAASGFVSLATSSTHGSSTGNLSSSQMTSAASGSAPHLNGHSSSTGAGPSASNQASPGEAPSNMHGVSHYNPLELQLLAT